MLMKYAVRSEFAGDLIAARAWVSAVAQAEKMCYRSALSETGYESSEGFKRITKSMQGNAEESTKRLRDAILLAEKLRWRCAALKLISSENRANAECALKCAIVIVECFHCLLSCNDKAEIILLEAAVAAVEPHVLQFFLDAEVQVLSSLVDDAEAFLRRSKHVGFHRREVTRTVEELETLVAQRDECQLPRLIDVYDEFIAVSRANLSHSVQCFEKLEAGDLHFPERWVGNWDATQVFFQEKLSVAKPVIEQVENACRRVAELQTSSDKLDQLEVRCWAGVVALLNAVLDPVLSTSYSRDILNRFGAIQCVGAQLRMMVVENLIGAAKQYQLEMRSERRPEVTLLFREAAQCAHTCAEKTLESIEALPITRSLESDAARYKWASYYHEASDRCAMLYEGAAAELRISYSLAPSLDSRDQIRATIYRIASEASVREAGVLAQQDLSAEETRLLQSSASEVNKLSVCLAEGLPAQCDPGAVETFVDLARRVLEDPAGIEVKLLAVRQAHDALMQETPVA
jgi:hypothetical protein